LFSRGERKDFAESTVLTFLFKRRAAVKLDIPKFLASQGALGGGSFTLQIFSLLLYVLTGSEFTVQGYRYFVDLARRPQGT